MKTILSLLLFLCYSTIMAQQDIDVSSNISTKTITVKTGNQVYNMINVVSTSKYNVTAEKKNSNISELVFKGQDVAKAALASTHRIGDFTLKRGQELKITIVETPIGGGTPNTFTYTYRTEKRGEWRSTFGFNFVYLTNNNTYFSDANDDNTFTITESNNKENFIYYPTLMFSWVSNNHIDKWKNWKAGFSGGIGYDFKTSLSVFAGGSLIYNENITITAGLAFHNQQRLSSNYSENDIINENLTFEQLHTDYIRVNPFISIAFRLDRNPFASSN